MVIEDTPESIMERRCGHDGYGGTLNPTGPDVVIDYPAFGHLCLK
jgi:hypothetical protein